MRPRRLRLLPNTIGSEAAAPARSICIASGKGGTGKSTVVASLARCLARRSSCLLFDADLGVANAHILQGVSPVYTAADVLSGRVDVRAALSDCGHGLKLLAGGSGLLDLANLTGDEIERLATALRVLQHRFPYLMVDSGRADAADDGVWFGERSRAAGDDAGGYGDDRCVCVCEGALDALPPGPGGGSSSTALAASSKVRPRPNGSPVSAAVPWSGPGVLGDLARRRAGVLATQERRPVVEGGTNALVQAMLELDGRLALVV
ncbi:MAG: P-loop NTPase [Planctomycetota bacterium]